MEGNRADNQVWAKAGDFLDGRIAPAVSYRGQAADGANIRAPRRYSDQLVLATDSAKDRSAGWSERDDAQPYGALRGVAGGHDLAE